MNSIIPVIIIGGGQAGISLSYYLQKLNIEHIILEKDRAFSSWHNRWDSFKLNTANWMNQLPGLDDFVPGKGDYYLASKQEALNYFQRYLEKVNPPLVERCEVTACQRTDEFWTVTTKQPDKRFYAMNIVCCMGINTPFLPKIAEQFPHWVNQLHSKDYRRPSQVNTNKVLVVGSGSSGVQICYDLYRSNRFETIYLSHGSNRHFPWRYLGLPIHFWAKITGLFRIKKNSLLGRKLYKISINRGDPAAPPSLHFLGDLNTVRILSRLSQFQDGHIICEAGEAMSVKDLSVIWCTGYRYNFDFIKSKHVFLQEHGEPFHDRGTSSVIKGLYFLGLRFQYTLGSHILYGIGKDAEYIAYKIHQDLFTNV